MMRNPLALNAGNPLALDPTANSPLFGNSAGWSSLGTAQTPALDKRRLLAQLLLRGGMGQPGGQNPNAVGSALQGFAGSLSPLAALLSR